MRYLCKDTGRILFVIRLFLFTFLLCAVLFCRSLEKFMEFTEIDFSRSQSKLMLGFQHDSSDDSVYRTFFASTSITQTGHFLQKVNPHSLKNGCGTLGNHCIYQRNMTFLMGMQDYSLSIFIT